MAFLEIDGIAKAYGRNTVLRETSLAVERGEFVCFLGPSGSGKTTLLNCISGVISPSRGRVVLEGEDITRMPVEGRRIGVVFQNYALFPNLSVGENVAYGLRGMARAERAERVAEMLRLVGMEDFGGRYPAELSGGQQQRVAVARALAPSPRMLLLDEPLSALDAHIRSRLGEDLRRLQRRLGITTIMVTHDQQEAMGLADRMAVLHEGRLEQLGTPRAVYEAPVSRFVAEFVGEMNFLPNRDGAVFGIRGEDVVVRQATELTLAEADTSSARIEDIKNYGKFVRLNLVLQDMRTTVFADIAAPAGLHFQLRDIVAVTFPEERRNRWP